MASTRWRVAVPVADVRSAGGWSAAPPVVRFGADRVCLWRNVDSRLAAAKEGATRWWASSLCTVTGRIAGRGDWGEKCEAFESNWAAPLARRRLKAAPRTTCTSRRIAEDDHDGDPEVGLGPPRPGQCSDRSAVHQRNCLHIGQFSTVEGVPTQLRFGCGTGASWVGASRRGRLTSDPGCPSGVRRTTSGDEVLGLGVVADDGGRRLLGMELEPLAHLDPDAVGPEQLDHLGVVLEIGAGRIAP